MDKKVRRRRGGTIFRHLAEVSILQQALASSTLCCFRLLSALLSGSEAAGPHGFSSESTGCAVVPALAAPLPLASGNNSSSCCPLALESAVASCNDLVQFSSVAQLCPTLCDPMNCSTPGLLTTNSQSPPKPMSIEPVMPSNHLILCRPLLLLLSIPPSIRVFSNESVFASGAQSMGVSASASVLPVNIQD